MVAALFSLPRKSTTAHLHTLLRLTGRNAHVAPACLAPGSSFTSTSASAPHECPPAHGRGFIPKGYHPSAQGCEERATLGHAIKKFQPQRGCIAVSRAWVQPLQG